jgi:hypothetical protein
MVDRHEAEAFLLRQQEQGRIQVRRNSIRFLADG